MKINLRLVLIFVCFAFSFCVKIKSAKKIRQFQNEILEGFQNFAENVNSDKGIKNRIFYFSYSA